MSKYKRAAVGGTFDILHIGHKHLLETSFQISEEVVIGVTSDKIGRRRVGKECRSRWSPYH